MNIVIEEIVLNPLIQIEETVQEISIPISEMQMPGATGADGKSAYQSALDGGFVGTELEFNDFLAQISNTGDQDLSDVVKNIAKEATQGPNITGTVSETILYSKLIPANTFKDGDFMNLFSRVGKSLQLGTLQHLVKINTSNTLTGATLIAFNFGIETNRIFTMSRTFTVSNGFLTGFSSAPSASSDVINNTNPPQFNVFDPTVNNYIFIACKLNNSADTIYHLGTKITN